MQYFAVGNSSVCFSFIQNWVEMRIRRHLARACQRRGLGWKRWSREWLYSTLGPALNSSIPVLETMDQENWDKDAPLCVAG